MSIFRSRVARSHWRSGSQIPTGASGSENLLDGVNRPLRTDLPDADGEHFATKALAFERAADDREDGELSVRRRTDLLSGRGLEAQEHERTRIHGVFPFAD